MTTDVLRLPGDYKIITSQGGALTLDVGRGTTGTNTGTVVILGNLDVKGKTTQLENIQVTITDPTLLLNQGNTFAPKSGGGYLSGIQISRSDDDDPTTSAYIQWNEEPTWNWPSSTAPQEHLGIFEFRIGDPNTITPTYSAIKINAIRIDETSAPKIDGIPRLNFFGSDNQTALLSVAGASNYADRLRSADNPDDIPNKEYVDSLLTANTGNATSLIVGHSYIKINDAYADGGTTEILMVVDGDPGDPKVNPSHGNKVLSLTQASAKLQGIQFQGNEISTVNTNADLYLSPNGTGVVVMSTPIVFTASAKPILSTNGQTALYNDAVGPGGTGVFFTTKYVSTTTSDEFVSRKKALIYSIIF